MTYNTYSHNLQLSDSTGLLLTNHISAWEQSQSLYRQQSYHYSNAFYTVEPALSWLNGLDEWGIVSNYSRCFDPIILLFYAIHDGKLFSNYICTSDCEKVLGQHSFRE